MSYEIGERVVTEDGKCGTVADATTLYVIKLDNGGYRDDVMSDEIESYIGD